MPLYNQCLDITLSVCAANSFDVQAFRLTAIVVDFQIGQGCLIFLTISDPRLNQQISDIFISL